LDKLRDLMTLTFHLSTLDSGSRHNHQCKFWWRSVKGFESGGGWNFAICQYIPRRP